jgi:hypothetical protein
MDPGTISTGVPTLDTFLAIIMGMGAFKGGMLGLRKFGNGYVQKNEPLTRQDLKEELRPLVDATQSTSESLTYLKGYFSGKERQ